LWNRGLDFCSFFLAFNDQSVELVFSAQFEFCDFILVGKISVNGESFHGWASAQQ